MATPRWGWFRSVHATQAWAASDSASSLVSHWPSGAQDPSGHGGDLAGRGKHGDQGVGQVEAGDHLEQDPQI